MTYYSEGLGEILLDNKIYVCHKTPYYGLNVCVPTKSYLGALTSSVTILEIDFMDVIKFKWDYKNKAFNWWNYSPYKRRHQKAPFLLYVPYLSAGLSVSVSPTCTEKGLCENIARRWLSISHEGNESASSNWILDFSASKLWEIYLCYLSHPACDTLLQQPQ